MKLTRRIWLLTCVSILAAVVAVVVFRGFGGPSEQEKREELVGGLRMVDSACDQWAIEMSMTYAHWPNMDFVRPYIHPGGWFVSFPAFDQLISGERDAWEDLPKSIRYRKRWHFLPDGKDPYGNFYIFNQMKHGPKIHPRTVFELASTPEGTALLKTLQPYLPFSATATFSEIHDHKVDLVRTIERATLLGQTEELKKAIAKALSEEEDYAASPRGSYGHDFRERSRDERLRLLRSTMVWQEVDATLQTLAKLEPQAIEAGSGALFKEHLEKYRAVQKELEQLRRTLETAAER